MIGRKKSLGEAAEIGGTEKGDNMLKELLIKSRKKIALEALQNAKTVEESEKQIDIIVKCNKILFQLSTETCLIKDEESDNASN